MGSDSISAGKAEPEVAETARDASAQAPDSSEAVASCADPESTQAPPGVAEESVEQLRAALEQAQAEAEAQKDRALRAAAEAENIRKRADRRVENAHRYALDKFVGELLPAVDGFERAVDAARTAGAENAAAAVAEGVQLSLKLFVEAMQREGIEVVDPLGAPFDPNLHEAMTTVESASAEPGSVMEVFQKGYTVNGRLVRAARVVVAKAPTAAKVESAQDAGAGDGSANADDSGA